jgi:spermidine/putrescine ABC transporter ATP-binding subunit
MFPVARSISKFGTKLKPLSNFERGLLRRLALAFLEIDNIRKSFGGKEVLKGLSIHVEQGEFLTLLGESGSGKTTLLRIIAGLETANSGSLKLQGSSMLETPIHKRPVNTVFQSYALFPHMNVFENVAYGLRVKGISDSEIPERVREALSMVKMSDFTDSHPAKLSGGQQQRIALARALVNRPKILLLDEPLSALDANLRHQMQTELKNLQKSLGITFIFVTHDQAEALALSDRVALLKDGGLEQVAPPEEIYNRPTTAYCARFIGHSNVLNCTQTAGTCSWEGSQWKLAAPTTPFSQFSLRPEKIHLANGQLPNNAVAFQAQVKNFSFEGAHILLDAEINSKPLRIQIPSSSKISANESFYFDPIDAVPLESR